MCTCIEVGGELDLFNVGLLRRIVDNALAGGARALVVDLGRITFLDLTAVGYLVELRRRAQAGEFALHIVPAPAAVMRVFDLTRTRDLLLFGAAA